MHMHVYACLLVVDDWSVRLCNLDSALGRPYDGPACCVSTLEPDFDVA